LDVFAICVGIIRLIQLITLFNYWTRWSPCHRL